MCRDLVTAKAGKEAKFLYTQSWASCWHVCSSTGLGPHPICPWIYTYDHVEGQADLHQKHIHAHERMPTHMLIAHTAIY